MNPDEKKAKDAERKRYERAKAKERQNSEELLRIRKQNAERSKACRQRKKAAANAKDRQNSEELMKIRKQNAERAKAYRQRKKAAVRSLTEEFPGTEHPSSWRVETLDDTKAMIQYGSSLMNFEKCEDRSSASGDGEKINFSTNSDESCSRLMSSVEDDMPMNEESCYSQLIGSDFLNVVIKCEEPEMSDSDTSNTEMNSKPQILNTVDTNEQSGLVVNIKPEPFEFENHVKEEFVSNQETGSIEYVAIKNEKTEMNCSGTMFFSEEAKNTNANTIVKCDPLDTETYVKQENEEYIDPSFSTCNSDYDNSSEDDRPVSANETSFRCDVCDKNLTRRDSLKNHMLTHTGEKPYQCDVCNKCFTQRSSLMTHKRLHSGEKPYQCHICNKTFNQLNRLNNHKNIHTGEKTYQCDACDKCFFQRESLKVHKLSHSGEKPYHCDICDKTFNRSSDLNKHKTTHTGEKPYQCDVCDKCFTQRHTLKRHMYLHSGEKPHQCDVCNKTFSQSQQLSTHKRTHTGERPFQCVVCDQTFIYANNLRRHILRHN